MKLALVVAMVVGMVGCYSEPSPVHDDNAGSLEQAYERNNTATARLNMSGGFIYGTASTLLSLGHKKQACEALDMADKDMAGLKDSADREYIDSIAGMKELRDACLPIPKELQ